MTARLTPQREASIVARAEAATPGPWVECTDYGKDFYAYTGGSHLRGVGTLNFGDGEDAEADLAFTLNAPEDVKALLAELATVRAERDEAALLRDFYRLRAVRLVNQRGEAEVANEAWELGQITAEEALRRTDAAIQGHKAVTLDQFRAEREARS